MSDSFEPEDGLTSRLRALGSLPVDPATQSQHLTAMAEAAAAPSLTATLGSRLRLAGALVLGFLLGTTGLASAGALGPLQPIAATAVEAATPLDVPNGKNAGEDAGTARFRGDGQQTCEDVEYRNRGQYLKAVKAKYAESGDLDAKMTAAKESDCGKPLSSLEGSEEADTADAPKEPKTKSSKAKSPKDAMAKNTAANGSENAEAACAGGAENGNAGGVKDDKVGDGADNADDGAAKPAEGDLAKPDCAGEAGGDGDGDGDADAAQPADPGAAGAEQKASTPAADAPADPPADPPADAPADAPANATATADPVAEVPAS